MTLFAATTFHSITSGGDGSAQHIFCPWWPCPLTLTFKLMRARDQTHLPWKFGANPFSGSPEIFYSPTKQNKKVTDSAKNRTWRSLLRTVTIRSYTLHISILPQASISGAMCKCLVQSEQFFLQYVSRCPLPHENAQKSRNGKCGPGKCLIIVLYTRQTNLSLC